LFIIELFSQYLLFIIELFSQYLLFIIELFSQYLLFIIELFSQYLLFSARFEMGHATRAANALAKEDLQVEIVLLGKS